MAGERTLPNMGLTAFWDLGDNTYKAGMDKNLLVLSVTFDARLIDILADRDATQDRITEAVKLQLFPT